MQFVARFLHALFFCSLQRKRAPTAAAAAVSYGALHVCLRACGAIARKRFGTSEFMNGVFALKSSGFFERAGL
jgi:hypothetical protein